MVARDIVVLLCLICAISVIVRHRPALSAFVGSAAVGGYNAQPGRFPYVAQVTNGSWLCTGFLIAPNTVMTAAHCFLDLANLDYLHRKPGDVVVKDNPKGVVVILGQASGYFSAEVQAKITQQKNMCKATTCSRQNSPAKSLADISKMTGGQAHFVSAIKMVRNTLKTDHLAVDYALLTLSTPAKAIAPVKVAGVSVKMPTEDWMKKTPYLRSLGYGRTQPYSTTVPQFLQEIPISIVDIDSRYFYGHGYKKGQSMCMGDSGGPLILVGATAADDVVVGINDLSETNTWRLAQGYNNDTSHLCSAMSVFYRTDNIARTMNSSFG